MGKLVDLVCASVIRSRLAILVFFMISLISVDPYSPTPARSRHIRDIFIVTVTQF